MGNHLWTGYRFVSPLLVLQGIVQGAKKQMDDRESPEARKEAMVDTMCWNQLKHQKPGLETMVETTWWCLLNRIVAGFETAVETGTFVGVYVGESWFPRNNSRGIMLKPGFNIGIRKASLGPGARRISPPSTVVHPDVDPGRTLNPGQSRKVAHQDHFEEVGCRTEVVSWFLQPPCSCLDSWVQLVLVGVAKSSKEMKH